MVISKQTSLMMTFTAMLIVIFTSTNKYIKIAALLIAIGTLILVFKERQNKK